MAAFTGGSLLLGSVGRTDLVGPWATDHLSHLQFRSARRLSEELAGRHSDPADPRVRQPLLGRIPDGRARRRADVHHQRSANPALLMDEDPFVARLVSGLDAYPRYYGYMAAEKP